jgi:hypothetical protein
VLVLISKSSAGSNEQATRTLTVERTCGPVLCWKDATEGALISPFLNICVGLLAAERH